MIEFLRSAASSWALKTHIEKLKAVTLLNDIDPLLSTWPRGWTYSIRACVLILATPEYISSAQNEWWSTKDP